MITSGNRLAGPYEGTGALATYSFSFKVFSKNDISVVVADTSGTETTLVLDSDYSVALNADQDASPGGTITLLDGNLAVDYLLSVIGNLAYAQSTQLPNGGAYNAAVVEQMADKLAIQIQQVREIANRAMQLPVTAAGVSATLPAIVPGAVFAWNTDGDAIVAMQLTDLDTVLVSAAAAGVLSQATVALMRTALGSTATGDAVFVAANPAAARAAIGAVIGTDVQAYHVNLAALAALTAAADKLPYFTGAGAAALADFPAYGRSLAAVANQAALLAVLGGAAPGSDTFLSGAGTWSAAGTSNVDGFEISGSTGSTVSIAAGSCFDSTRAAKMAVATAYTKTTSTWAVGSGNGALDEGAVTTNSSYHWYVIRRPDTGVVDYLCSLSNGRVMPATITIATPAVVTCTGHGLFPGAGVVFSTTGALPTGLVAGTRYYVISAGITDDVFRVSATIGGAAINTSGSQSGTHTVSALPALPTGYTRYRNIGGRMTNGSSQFYGTSQIGDDVTLTTPLLDISTTAAFTSATLRYLNCPGGYAVRAWGNCLWRTDVAGPLLYLSNPAQTDSAPSATVAPLATAVAGASAGASWGLFRWECVTGTQRQIRTRHDSTGGPSTYDFRLTLAGWSVDRRVL